MSKLTQPVRNLMQDIDRSSRVSTWAAFALSLFTAIATYPLVDHCYYERAFEADAWICVDYTRSFMRFIWHLDPAALPPLNSWPPYFDGVFILHALGSLAMIPLRNLHLLDPFLLPTEDSVIIWAIRQMNWLGYAIASIPFFRAAKLLSRSNLLAFVLGAIFALSPMIIDLDIMRIDYPIITAYVFILWFSLRIIHADRSLTTGALLGLFMAFLVNAKITGVALGFIPALAVTIAIVRGRYRWSQLLVAGAAFLILSAFLGVRYLMHASEIVSDFQAKIAGLETWTEVFSIKPLFYYNWHYYLPYGHVFMGFFVLCLFATIYQLRKKPRRAIVFLLLVLGGLTLMGIPVMKYVRGGYTMLPVYLLLIAASVRVFARAARPRCGGKECGIWITALCLLCLLPACHHLGTRYFKQLKLALDRPASIRVTRIEPRRWFESHVLPGARIAHVWGSDWASPPIFDLGYSFTARIIDIPLRWPERRATYEPPAFEVIERSCDVILLNDFYNAVQSKTLRDCALPDLADKWDAFYRALGDRYPTRKFRAESPNYLVRETQVFIVNKAVMKDLQDAGLVEQGR